RLSCSPCHQQISPLGHLHSLNTLEVGRVAAAADRLLEVPAAA
ncbi:lipopolysaccharide heptosyltransferase II, partial [Mesorhizobium sp. M8A.F.Ca.ET.023.02.2.1]